MKKQTYFSFRQPSDWQYGKMNNVEVEQQGLRLTREQRYRHSKRMTLNLSTDLFNWLDSCLVSEGWFWLNDQNEIYRYDKHLHERELILKLELDSQSHPYRLAVKHEYVYVLSVAYTDGQAHSTLSCFYLNSGQLKWKSDNWKQTLFTSYSLVVSEQESIVLTAQLADQSEFMFLQFDGMGFPMNDLVIPELSCNSSLEEVAISWNKKNRLVTAQSEIYLYDYRNSQLIIYQSVQQQMKRITLPIDTDETVTFTIDNKGQFWFSQPSAEQHMTALICFDSSGNILQKGTLMSGQSDYIIVSKKTISVFDMKQAVAYLLEPNQLPLFSEELQGYRGWWISQPLDSEVLGTIWHRFVLAMTKQHDTTVNLKYFASDSNKVDVEKLDGLWQNQLEDPEDALFVNAIGQYLWIGIEIIGTDSDTPYIESLEVHFPRQSYVNDLPVIYQRSDKGFLTSYLSLFQTMIEDTNLKIEGATRNLEPQQASDESLKWLLGWMGLDTDDYWTEEQLRMLLQEAPTLFRLRGTRFAIERIVEIYTGKKPILLEYDDIKNLKENIELGEVIDKLYAADEHTFNVLVKADDVSSELKKITLQHILDRYKPVFTTCKLVILQPWVYMDLHSYLGMNTFLTAPQQLLLNGQMSMPHHTITLDAQHHNQLDKHSRIGLNSKLE